MKRKLALAMVLAMTASMAQPVLAADSKTTLDVIISQYGTQTQAWWSQFEKDFETENTILKKGKKIFYCLEK